MLNTYYIISKYTLMEIEVFKLMIYNFAYDTETVHRQSFPLFRRLVIEAFGIEPNQALYFKWIQHLHEAVTSGNTDFKDDDLVAEVIFEQKRELLSGIRLKLIEEEAQFHLADEDNITTIPTSIHQGFLLLNK